MDACDKIKLSSWAPKSQEIRYSLCCWWHHPSPFSQLQGIAKKFWNLRFFLEDNCILRWNSLVEVSGHKLKSYQTQVFV
jgi:hypothetical protein